MKPEEFLTDSPLGRAVYERVRAVLAAVGGADVRVTVSQIGFRRRRGFAWLWLPGRYLAHPAADVVLSIALDREEPSPRWKEVAHPSRRHWVHHLELRDAAEVDDEVTGWLREAAALAG
ncbi:DUF5655 domain-containing protein [Geodermatophilus sabuli]|uniref:DUF5655 domain-containing protein n=1 Tax=Geodermatophilus sabuli TaxID=1564158 RepID=A0A285ELU3_9ACTN|nr:DUF5655 domain-containing protein [Geodermatophilus sabuli]MBB3083626.1 hypothetical protein [Geodermatophilus sabuli]SNX99056.1 hypothetical protein SAMN06893097_11416 [Geodermatophilus sabuli]